MPYFRKVACCGKLKKLLLMLVNFLRKIFVNHSTFQFGSSKKVLFAIIKNFEKVLQQLLRVTASKEKKEKWIHSIRLILKCIRFFVRNLTVKNLVP